MARLKHFKHACLAIAMSQVVTLSVAHGAMITVNHRGDTHPSIPASVCTLREAIATVNAAAPIPNGCAVAGTLGTNDKIVFATNLAGATISLDGGQLYINKDLVIDGEVSAPHYGTLSTTISANGSGRVLQVIQPASVSLDNLTLKDGLLTGTSSKGGGVFINSGASLSLNNSTITDNTAAFGGGIYASSSSSITLDSTIISNNHAVRSGGGLFVVSAKATIQNRSQIVQNTSTNYGGGIFSTTTSNLPGSPTLTIDRSNISTNIATDGGAIYTKRASWITVSNSSFGANEATRNGGAVHADGDFGTNRLEISNTRFIQNHAANEGGGIAAISAGAEISLNESIMDTNYSGGLGGAINFRGEKLEIISTTFDNNDRVGDLTYTASIANYGDLTIRNSTIVSLATGGAYTPYGIFSRGSLKLDSSTLYNVSGLALEVSDSTTLMRNTILAGRGSSGTCSATGHMVFTDLGGNLVQSGNSDCANFDLEGLDPMLGPLQDNGGPDASYEGLSRPIETMALLPDSPAIDAGITWNATDTFNIRIGVPCQQPGGGEEAFNDQRDVPRDDELCDIGAYEAEATEKGGTFFVIPLDGEKAVIFGL